MHIWNQWGSVPAARTTALLHLFSRTLRNCENSTQRSQNQGTHAPHLQKYTEISPHRVDVEMTAFQSERKEVYWANTYVTVKKNGECRPPGDAIIRHSGRSTAQSKIFFHHLVELVEIGTSPFSCCWAQTLREQPELVVVSPPTWQMTGSGFNRNTWNTLVPVKPDLNSTEQKYHQYLDACFGFACTLLFVRVHFSGLLAAIWVIRRSTSQSWKEANRRRETEEACPLHTAATHKCWWWHSKVEQQSVGSCHTHAVVAGGSSLRAAWGTIRVVGPHAGRALSVLQTASWDWCGASQTSPGHPPGASGPWVRWPADTQITADPPPHHSYFPNHRLTRYLDVLRQNNFILVMEVPQVIELVLFCRLQEALNVS